MVAGSTEGWDANLSHDVYLTMVAVSGPDAACFFLKFSNQTSDRNAP
ncbi:hypothetical protein ILFOPFJJ_02481 [Ensifer psoraleae]|nr:hypothetical protein [Sinorhizobium psoraleae]